MLRRRLVALIVVVLTSQISGLEVSVVQRLGAWGGTEAPTCCCFRQGSPGHCPVCCRTPRLSARCTCGCQHHDAAVPPLLSLDAVLPLPVDVFADNAVEGAPAQAGPSFSDFTPVPPSPPPRRGAL